jgi:putative DNA primase/helicase
MHPSMGDFARRYRQQIGWSIIPLVPRDKDKRPLLTTWKEWQTKRATALQIEAWWRRWPTANIGIVTGRISGLVVVDLDGP